MKTNLWKGKNHDNKPLNIHGKLSHRNNNCQTIIYNRRLL